MTKFEKLSAKTIGMVKGAIENNYATIVFEDSDWILNDKSDIYSLYDHDNLFIFRYGDNHYVGLFKSFYMKDQTCVIIYACMPDEFDLYDKAKQLKNYHEECSKIEDMFKKAKQYDEALKSKLNQNASEDVVNDVFAAFGTMETYPESDDVRIQSTPLMDAFMKTMPSSMREDFEKYKKEHGEEERAKMKSLMSQFEKKHGRKPSAEEFLDMTVADLNLDEEEKARLKELFKQTPIFRVSKLLGDLSNIMK